MYSSRDSLAMQLKPVKSSALLPSMANAVMAFNNRELSYRCVMLALSVVVACGCYLTQLMWLNILPRLVYRYALPLEVTSSGRHCPVMPGAFGGGTNVGALLSRKPFAQFGSTMVALLHCTLLLTSSLVSNRMPDFSVRVPHAYAACACRRVSLNRGWHDTHPQVQQLHAWMHVVTGKSTQTLCCDENLGE